MKNSILLFLLGIFVAISFAGTINLPATTVKPQLPRLTFVKAYHNKYNVQEDIEADINYHIRQGYIVKIVSMSEYEDWQRGVLVMEKY